MNRRRLLFIGLLALLVGSFSSFVVYRNLRKQAMLPAPGVAVVIAAHDLVSGQMLGDHDLKLVVYPDGSLPEGSLHSMAAAIGHSVVLPIAKGNFVTSNNLAADGNADRLERLIPAGMRAASVSVNDVTSVAGFARPGSLVDVLVTGPTPDAHRLQSMTVLQRVRVLATGNQMEGSPSKDGRDARVVTLLVTPDDAERLALATQQGRVQLVIRNPLDGSQDKRTPIDSLGGISPARNRVRVKYVPAPDPDEHEIELHRGEHVERIKVRN
jgi:pilus assembly protein CpaB